MEKLYKLSLFVFRRDLRLQDNNGLMAALNDSVSVIPCFIFDERQIKNNRYRSDNCLQFMITSLNELDAQLKKKNSHLYTFYGIAEKVIESLLANYPIEAVYINRDYTPFSLKRDQQIAKCCESHKVAFLSYADSLLHEPEQILKANKAPYTIFTYAYQFARELPISKPSKNLKNNYFNGKIINDDCTLRDKLNPAVNTNLAVVGGRKEGLSYLKKIARLHNYQQMRDFPAADGTTKLSAHNKFGTISIREFYAAVVEAFNKNHTLIKEIYWRDFFTHIAYHFPDVFEGAFHKKYNHIHWSNDKKLFNAWCNGNTGFPIVDAGMRELNTTGYMHNRVRMIVASFLTKDLHVDWRWGEKYFAEKLVDYDPAVNNGNWQWAASTGCDAQPYFRIFNPWLQQKKFDPDCIYIKKWIPELIDLSVKEIHDWPKTSSKTSIDYPSPIIDHSIESRKALSLYKS